VSSPWHDHGVDPTDKPETRLAEARRAVADRRWGRAYDLFSAVAATRALEPGDLERLAKAAYWTGHSDESISDLEAAYAGYIERRDDLRAAFCALTLQRHYIYMLRDSVATGWLRQAERLLEGQPESPGHGYLAIAHADAARARNDFARALAHVNQALDIAARSKHRNLHAWGVMRRGMFLVDEGRVDEGRRLMQEVAASAAGGELGNFTTGAVFSNVMIMCRDLADYRRGREWSDAAKRWYEQQAIRGFPGVCRIRRSEILRMLGDLRGAESESERACAELAGFSPAYVGAAHLELGEVRLRLGDLVAAEEAFRRAHELGEDSQPGLALVRLAQGKLDTAAALIRWSVAEGAFDRFARTRTLSAQVETAGATGDAEAVRSACDELAEIADQLASPAVHATNEWARGILALLKGDREGGKRHLAQARRRWNAVGAPYEAAKAAVALAEASVSEGDLEAATTLLEAAETTLERMGARLEARRAAQLVARARVGFGQAIRTFMFTDIVGSTSLIGVIGDEAWDDLRRWHDQALRTCFEEHGGEETDHAGDGFFVAFPDATSGVACAIDIQQRLIEHRRTHGFAPQVRIGLHTTEATRDGADYTGLGVHAASRIASLAGPNEILASAETVDGLGRVPTLDRRTESLKGIVQPVEVVVIDWHSSVHG
jgi:class 3 adenylate cyclase